MSSIRPAHSTVLFAALACAAFSGACRSTRAPAPPVTATHEMERAVWEALLRDAYVDKDTKVLVVSPHLQWGGEDWGERPREIPPDAWRAFVAAFQREGMLPPDLDPGLPIAWYSSEDFRDLPSNDSLFGTWRAFHERYPGNSGHILLSHVGFTRDGRTAVVYGFVGSAPLSASGDIYLLRKTARGWRIVRTHNFVVS